MARTFEHFVQRNVDGSFVVHPNYRSNTYSQRTDRNRGWINPVEQELIRSSVVGIAGCGGMGGLLAATLLRLGVGEIRIADCENFDQSNINRQFGANRFTVGKSKAEVTAEMLYEIADDARIVVYPSGINSENVISFLSGCDIVCDEIEFWAIGARSLLHLEAQSLNVPLITCSSVGFGSRLFLFDHHGASMEEMLGFTLVDAFELEKKVVNGEATKDEIWTVFVAMLDALIPELPGYDSTNFHCKWKNACVERLKTECKAPIIATNPPLASGFAANHTLIQLIKGNVERNMIPMPPITPGYLYLDSVLMDARVVERKEVLRGEW